MTERETALLKALDDIILQTNASTFFTEDAKSEFITDLASLKYFVFTGGIIGFKHRLGILERENCDMWCHLLDELFAQFSPPDALMTSVDQLESYLSYKD